MDSTWWQPDSTEEGRVRLLRRAITVLALALVVYLPLETGLISGLPPTAYWVLRLLPDALIAVAAVAVVLVGDPRARTTPVRLLWAVGVITALIVITSAGRGLPLADAVNAIRLLVRYLVLGLLLWWAVDGRWRVDDLVIRVILIAAVLEVLVASGQIASRIVSHGASLSLTDLLLLDGTFGRYDRFGLFLMGVIIALVATSKRLWSWRLVLGVACVVLLFLSTSRQAMVGLAVGCLVIAVMPPLTGRQRAFAGAMAALGLALVLTSPSGVIAPTPPGPPVAGNSGSPGNGDEPAGNGDEPAGNGTPTRPIKDTIKLTTDPNRNFRIFYNLELAPWAAATEPLIGFGPRQQVAEDPDPRLQARVAAAGMDWKRARQFTNDSNYASLVIQFGAVVPALFLALLVAAILAAARIGLRREEPVARFAVGIAAATLVVAFFGPAFEMRTISIMLWIGIFGVLASRNTNTRGGSPMPTTDADATG